MPSKNDLKGNVDKKKVKVALEQGHTRPPAWLDAMAKDYWKALSGPLHDAGILNVATYELVANMCHAFSTYREAAEKLKKEGRVIKAHTGALKVNPWLTVERTAYDQVLRGYKELGICSDQVKPLADELDAFLEGDE